MSQMRDEMALGYVVGCDLRRANGTLGFRTVVESQYPMAVVHQTIEKSIDDLVGNISSHFNSLCSVRGNMGEQRNKITSFDMQKIPETYFARFIFPVL